MLKFRCLAIVALLISLALFWGSLNFMDEAVNPFLLTVSAMVLALTPFTTLAALFFFSFSFVAIRRAENGGYLVKKDSFFGRVFVFFAGEGEKGYCLAFWRTVGIFILVPIMFIGVVGITTMIFFDTMKFLRVVGTFFGVLVGIGLLGMFISFLSDMWDRRDHQTQKESGAPKGDVTLLAHWFGDLFDSIERKWNHFCDRVAESRAVELLKLFHSGACPRIHVE